MGESGVDEGGLKVMKRSHGDGCPTEVVGLIVSREIEVVDMGVRAS